jgi:hypothetical protein
MKVDLKGLKEGQEMMKNRNAQRGEGNLGCIAWVLLAIVAGLFLYTWVPVRVANSSLHDYMLEQAKYAQSPQPEVFKKRIVDKARELGLPVTAKDVKVEITGDRVRMRCKYSVPLEFPFYTYIWEIDHNIDRPIYYV